jgi:hypothetical protein
MSLSATNTYLNKNIRWNIQSFINDSDIWKAKFDEVVQLMFWKAKFSSEVVIRFNKGARLVAEDEYGVCTNCYHYGDQEASGSADGFCMNHAKGDCAIWIDFAKFSELSRFGAVYNTYEEYEIERRIDYLKKKARADELAKEQEMLYRAMIDGARITQMWN